MSNQFVVDLADCAEFRQTVLLRPPRLVHGTALLLSALLASAVLWLAFTEADLVVRATGKVRPVTPTQKVAPLSGGQIAEVYCSEGQQVRRRDLLIKLDTERLDNEISKQQRTIQTAEQELDDLTRLQTALERKRAFAEVKEGYQTYCEEAQVKRDAKCGEIQAARIALQNLRKERDQAFLRAELAGVVTVVKSGSLKVGEVLKAEEPVVEIAEEKGFRFEVQVPSEDMGHVVVGMPARVRINAFDYQRYGTLDGTVCFIAPDASVPDGQRPASYLVKIELLTGEVGRGEFRGSIKLGMEGLAEIVTEHESLLSLLVKKIRQTISLG